MPLEQVFNPLRYTCAPNHATPDYVATSSFEDFVAYGLTKCWLSPDADDVNDSLFMARPWTKEDVRELRECFLAWLESAVGFFWDESLSPGHGDMDYEGHAGVFVANEEQPDSKETQLCWRVRFDDDCLMMALEGTGMDPEDIWLRYEALEDRQAVVDVFQRARATIGSGEVWGYLFDLVDKYERNKKGRQLLEDLTEFAQKRYPALALIDAHYEGEHGLGAVVPIAYMDEHEGLLPLTEAQRDELDMRVEGGILDLLPGGWDIEEGGYGEVEINLPEATLHVEHHERETRTIDTSWDVE